MYVLTVVRWRGYVVCNVIYSLIRTLQIRETFYHEQQIKRELKRTHISGCRFNKRLKAKHTTLRKRNWSDSSCSSFLTKSESWNWFYYSRITKGENQGKICHTRTMIHSKTIKLSKWTHIMCHLREWYIRKDMWSVTTRISGETHEIKQAVTQTNTIDTGHTLNNNLNP